MCAGFTRTWQTPTLEREARAGRSIIGFAQSAENERGMSTSIEADNELAARLLQRYAAGDASAKDGLFDLIHDDLRRRAHRWSHGPDATLSTTALVHETWLRVASADLSLNDRAHFFRIAARAMRRVLIDAARRNDAQKRGDGLANVTLDTGLPAPAASVDMLALDQALESLAASEPRLARIVELHFFAGLDFVDIARLLDLSERTVGRDWRTARALLRLSLDDACALEPARRD